MSVQLGSTDASASAPTALTLRPGDVVGERYCLIEPLASGGMGAVWRAMHKELSVEVALEDMLSEVASTPSAEARFRAEAQASARLRSPNVVQVTDFGVTGGLPYLAMELLRGEDLQARLERRGRLSLEECAVILDGVSKGIQIAHDGRIIHRDVKPANIFLAQEGGAEIVKVLDFGVAKVESPRAVGKTTGSDMVGSPTYMSPEQVSAGPITFRSDIWSLAVVVYEMVVGENPFEAPSLATTFELIVRRALPRARDRRPDLPASLDLFFDRALERDPERRYASAIELAGAFREAIRDVVSGSPTPVSFKYNPQRTADPNSLTVAVPQAPIKRRARAPFIVGLVTLIALLVYALRGPSPDAGSATASTAAPESLLESATTVAVSSAMVDPAPMPAASGEAMLAPDSAMVGAAALKNSSPSRRVAKPAVTQHVPSPAVRSTVHPKFGVPRTAGPI